MMAKVMSRLGDGYWPGPVISGILSQPCVCFLYDPWFNQSVVSCEHWTIETLSVKGLHIFRKCHSRWSTEVSLMPSVWPSLRKWWKQEKRRLLGRRERGGRMPSRSANSSSNSPSHVILNKNNWGVQKILWGGGGSKLFRKTIFDFWIYLQLNRS